MNLKIEILINETAAIISNYNDKDHNQQQIKLDLRNFLEKVSFYLSINLFLRQSL